MEKCAVFTKNTLENHHSNHERPKSILKVNFFVFVAYFIPPLRMVPIIFHFQLMVYPTKTTSWKKLESPFETDFGKINLDEFYFRWFNKNANLAILPYGPYLNNVKSVTI